jgi:hypothetical protein
VQQILGRPPGWNVLEFDEDDASEQFVPMIGLLGRGRQVATAGELLDLLEHLPRNTPIVVDPVLRAFEELPPGRDLPSLSGIATASSVEVWRGHDGGRDDSSTHDQGDGDMRRRSLGAGWKRVPAVRLHPFAAPAGHRLDELPHLHRLPAVGDHDRARELQFQGHHGAALPFLAAHLFQIAEQVDDQPDLPPDSRELRQLQDLAELLHQVARQIEQLAAPTQTAIAVAEAFEDSPSP